MSENNDLIDPSVQNAGDGPKLTCHLVKLPRIILTRIDEGNLVFKNKSVPLKKTPLKRLGTQKSIKRVTSKRMISTDAQSNKRKVPKGKTKKKQPMAVKLPHLHKKNALNKETFKLKKPARTGSKGESETKTLLKKTMLQKRSKVVIPSAKKNKLSPQKLKKSVPSTPKKRITPNKKLNTVTPKSKTEKISKVKNNIQSAFTPKPKTENFSYIENVTQSAKHSDLDTSEDEFLYDELIEELENSPKKLEYFQSSGEKTTNITLKPNAGNKPPTVIKGGIVKKTNLPADLQPIASTNTINSKETSAPVNTIPGKNKTLLGKNKLQNSSDSSVPTKKPSPWPISAPSATKKDLNSQKNQKTAVKKVTMSNQSNTPKPSKSLKNKPKDEPEPAVNDLVSKPTTIDVVKPKLGPKQTAKVTPLSKSLVEDDLSDEYTEEETLENLDYEPFEDLSKPETKSITSLKNTNDVDTALTKTPSFNSTKDDADPNLDLLRILTDDTDDSVATKANKYQEKETQNSKISKNETPTKGGEKSSSSESLNNNYSNEVEEEPPVRTIYDLMNDISLQYPSWNLHIMPETNAFCIAQVTKGRLGLPTLKKCIELDPVDYNAKVYIHQYHIKRFDGIYDSEESIVALIQEINSIKA